MARLGSCWTSGGQAGLLLDVWWASLGSCWTSGGPAWAPAARLVGQAGLLLDVWWARLGAA